MKSARRPPAPFLASLVPLAALALTVAACGNKESPSPEPAKTGAPAVPQGPKPTAGGQFAASPGQTTIAPTPQVPTGGGAAPTGYSLADIKTIPDNCASPVALLATAPGSVGDNYAWPISRQAFLANQQFRVTPGAPSVPGEVQLQTYKYNSNAYALIARCKDGGTCNNVAAMYKAIIRSSHPQVVCGPLNGLSSSPVGPGFGWQPTPQQNLPTDTIGQCARLDACRIATDRSTPGDPFLECQKAPHTFKLDCASRYPCSEVLACLSR